jgi:(2Fe-2S) ferredoxin
MSNLASAISEFSLVGQLLEITSLDSQEIDSIVVAAAEGKCRLKLSKKAQSSLTVHPQLGCWLEIEAVSRQHPKTGEMKLKAKSLRLKTNDMTIAQPALLGENQDRKREGKKSHFPVNILVCGHSKCWKRGGKAICQILEENINSRGWQQEVKVKTTDCLKKCKYAPNLIMMPDRTTYSKVEPQEIPLLLDKHL